MISDSPLISRAPAERVSDFAASRRGQLVHRIREIELLTYETGSLLRLTGLCGSTSLHSFFVTDPEEFGGVCRRCDAVFFGAIVYRCYSADGQLLYIGSTNRWAAREAMHVQKSPWWPDVARIDKSPQRNIGIARRVEAAAIRDEAPVHNRHFNVKRFRRDGYAYVPITGAA